MKILSLATAAFCALTLSACVTEASYAPAKLTEVFSPRTPPENIELYRSQTPTKKFLEIGAVSICCGRQADWAVQDLRKKASEAGGDALINLELDATGGATATVIRYQP